MSAVRSLSPSWMIEDGLDRLISEMGFRVGVVEEDGQRWYDALHWISSISSTSNVSSYWAKLKNRMEENWRSSNERIRIDISQVIRNIEVEVETANGRRVQRRDFLSELGVYLATLLMKKSEIASAFKVDIALLAANLSRSAKIQQVLKDTPELSLIAVDPLRWSVWQQREDREPGWTLSRLGASHGFKELIDTLRGVYRDEWEDFLNGSLHDEILSGIFQKPIEVVRERLGVDAHVDPRDHMGLISLMYLRLALVALKERVALAKRMEQQYTLGQFFDDLDRIVSIFGQQLDEYHDTVVQILMRHGNLDGED